jgi:TRAP-type C4-dicarboxylate transport system permease small subunit
MSFRKVADYTEEGLCVLIFASMSSIAFVNIITRYLLHYSLAFTEELTINMFVWLTLLGTSIGFKRGSHLAVTVIINMFPKKIQKVIFIFTTALCIGLFILLITCAVQQIISEYHMGTISDALGIKVYRYTIGVPIFTLLIILRIFEVALKHLKKGDKK